MNASNGARLSRLDAESITRGWLTDPIGCLEMRADNLRITTTAHRDPLMISLKVWSGHALLWRAAYVVRNGAPRLHISQLKPIKSARALDILEGIRAAVWGWGL
jgi:hypothetical protein